MGCKGCSVGSNADGSPKGCQSNGGCSTGGCNRLNTYDWLSKLDLPDTNDYHLVEVSFKNGSRKGFFINEPHTRAITGDNVVVETGAGSDVGMISLSGDLVRLQMKKKRVAEDSILLKVIRRANERDMEKLQEARNREKVTMVRARVITRTLDLAMKVGDVEFQADKRKATFYYTADGRVDFRELIRHFAKEFKVKIEMRQIGARQESARIGGIGSCGRELCCSTWLSDFKSVSTAAARYQNLAINQAKLSGQCGRLKCCLNYELDTYMDALEEFPKKVDALFTQVGKAVLVKTDIFKRTMYFAYIAENGFRGQFYPLKLERVKEILAMNKKGEKPAELVEKEYGVLLGAGSDGENEAVFGGEELTGIVELPPEERRKKGRNRNKNRNKKRAGNQGGQNKSRNRDQKPGDKKERPDGRNKSRSGKPKPKGDNKGTSQQKPKPQQRDRSKNSPSRGKGGEQKGGQNPANKPKKKSKWFNRKNKGKKPDGGGGNNNNNKKD